MPAKDIYHNAVKNALIKDGWAITKENFHVVWGRKDLYVDIGAEKLFTAEKKGRKIAVEVKSFVGRSEIKDLRDALGQFFLYRFVLSEDEPDRVLYLAMKEDAFGEILEDVHGQKLIRAVQLKLIVFNEVTEEIVQWIE
jgi:hypothetical protein